MYTSRGPRKLASRYTATVQKLFQGLAPAQIAASSSDEQFWNAFFSLEVDRDFFTSLLAGLSKDDCINPHIKSVINLLFTTSVIFARRSDEDVVPRGRAIDTLSILLRNLLAKNFAGWEVMEIFAGDVNESDRVFMSFVEMIMGYLEDDNAPAQIRHQALQLVVIYTCSINQLSPGAYLFRRDFYPSIVKLVRSPETERFTFEGMIFLSLLANYHKSDAAKLNPYLQRIQSTTDTEFMRKICWAANFACDTAVRAYHDIIDDTIPTLSRTVGTLIASLRPDRVLSPQPLDPHKELFKEQPIEASVALLPLFDFLYSNPLFTRVFLESSSVPNEKAPTTRIPPFPYTTLSLSSYILTHASSSASRRALSYASLTMNLLLVMAENPRIMELFCQPSTEAIRICRQRQPPLSPSSSTRPPVCALLDCCVLWLRHNLHKCLETHTYTTCVWVCYRTIWYLQKVRKRLDYRWQELWSALLGLLAFLCKKIDNPATVGGMDRLVQEMVCLLDLALCRAEVILPTAADTHMFVYELVRSSDVLRRHALFLQSLGELRPTDKRLSRRSDTASKALRHLLSVVSYYEGQMSATTMGSAKGAFRVLSKLIEKDGLHGVNSTREAEDPPNRAEDVTGFIRFAYGDALSLMP